MHVVLPGSRHGDQIARCNATAEARHVLRDVNLWRVAQRAKAAAEFAQDAPRLELGVGAFAKTVAGYRPDWRAFAMRACPVPR